MVNSTWAVDLTEVYSPPRCTAACGKRGLRPGSALDLRTGWNFDYQQDRLAAKDLIEAEDPALLVLSPYCSPFSVLQNLSKDKQNPEARAAMLAQARSHLAFCVDLALHRVSRETGFLMEQPLSASSWQEECMMKLYQIDEVIMLKCDQCRFGLKVDGAKTVDLQAGEYLSRKPTGFLTNVPELARYLAKRCTGGHAHGQLIGGKAKVAEEYTPGLVDAILRGLRTARASSRSPPKKSNGARRLEKDWRKPRHDGWRWRLRWMHAGQWNG